MYAVIKTGGKQYRVAVGDKIKVESLNAAAGDKVTLDQVLMIGDGDNITVGTPTVNSSVEATVKSNGRGKKLRIVKFRRRQNSRTRTGHRQNFTELEITAIGGPRTKVKKATPAKAEKTVTTKVEKTGVEKTGAEKKASKKPEKTAATPKKDISKAADDNLAKISGVGPVIVGKLQTLGITSLQQVADLSDEDIVRIDAELNFKGRIERDEWVKQAKELLKG